MKNIFKALAYTVLVVVGIAFVVGMIGGSKSGNRSTQIQRPPKPAESEYADVWHFDYRKAVLGDYPKGKLAKFTGEIDQIIGDSGAMISIREIDQYNYSGEQVLLVFESKPRIIEDDLVEIKGRYVSPTKYKTVLGVEREVPLFQVDYYTSWQKPSRS